MQPSDLLIVIPSSSSRTVLVHGSRPWRRGIRTLVTTNSTPSELHALRRMGAEHLESYAGVPDEKREPPEEEDTRSSGVKKGEKKKRVKPYSKRPGDYRAALSPFLAHKLFNGTYRWMLYGDDDTLFYLHGTQLLLRGLDPDQPIALSDNLWILQSHPSLLAPRCLPCRQQEVRESSVERDGATAAGPEPGGKGEQRERGHLLWPSLAKILGGRRGVQRAAVGEAGSSSGGASGDGSGAGAEASSRSTLYVPPLGCPSCTPEAACAPLLAAGHTRCRPPGAHGGAGIIFSHGLMEALPLPRVQRCFSRNRGASGGDRLLSACLQHFNVSFTDPGYWLEHLHQRGADVSGRRQASESDPGGRRRGMHSSSEQPARGYVAAGGLDQSAAAAAGGTGQGPGWGAGDGGSVQRGLEGSGGGGTPNGGSGRTGAAEGGGLGTSSGTPGTGLRPGDGDSEEEQDEEDEEKEKETQQGQEGEEDAADHVFQQYVVFDNKQYKRLLLDPWDALESGDCGPHSHCAWLLRHAVSLHMGSRFFPSLRHAARAMLTATAAHQRALGNLTQSVV